MKKYILLCILLQSVLYAAQITTVEIENYTSQIASPYFRPAYACIDGSGLGANGTHTTAPENYMWLSAYGDLAPKITFDLGSIQFLESVRIWNYNEIAPWINRSVKNMNILVSTDNVTYTLAKSIVLAIAPASSIVDFSETIFLQSANVRYVKFDIQSNYGDGGYSGLSEVQFYGVPELSTGLYLVMSLLGAALWRKYRL